MLNSETMKTILKVESCDFPLALGAGLYFGSSIFMSMLDLSIHIVLILSLLL